MIDIVPRLDKTQIFWDLDDCLGARSHAGETPAGSHRFYQDFEANYAKRLKLSTDDKRKSCQSKLCLSEVMTIVVLFHGCWIQNIQRILSE